MIADEARPPQSRGVRTPLGHHRGWPVPAPPDYPEPSSPPTGSRPTQNRRNERSDAGAWLRWFPAATRSGADRDRSGRRPHRAPGAAGPRRQRALRGRAPRACVRRFGWGPTCRRDPRVGSTAPRSAAALRPPKARRSSCGKMDTARARQSPDITARPDSAAAMTISLLNRNGFPTVNALIQRTKMTLARRQ